MKQILEKDRYFNNIDLSLESFFNRGVEDNVKQFNCLEEGEFDWNLYEYYIGHEND